MSTLLGHLAVLAGRLLMLLFGLLVNVLLFPEMWQQEDAPKFLRLVHR